MKTNFQKYHPSNKQSEAYSHETDTDLSKVSASDSIRFNNHKLCDMIQVVGVGFVTSSSVTKSTMLRYNPLES